MTQTLRGWSARKAAVEAEAKADEIARLEAQKAAEIAALEARPDEELLAEAGLPDPDTLDTPDAVQDFLAHRLPERLKQRALRRLWRLNPVLANVDGLVDYGEDFTDSAMVVENMQTAYTVGKGMLEQFKSLPEDDSAPPASEPSTPSVDVALEGRDAPPPEPPANDGEPEDAAPVSVASINDTPAELPASERRMRFRFDT